MPNFGQLRQQKRQLKRRFCVRFIRIVVSADSLLILAWGFEKFQSNLLTLEFAIVWGELDLDQCDSWQSTLDCVQIMTMVICLSSFVVRRRGGCALWKFDIIANNNGDEANYDVEAGALSIKTDTVGGRLIMQIGTVSSRGYCSLFSLGVLRSKVSNARDCD